MDGSLKASAEEIRRRSNEVLGPQIEIEKRANRNATQEAERETGIEDSPESRERGGGDV
jgi:hypothetical protein